MSSKQHEPVEFVRTDETTGSGRPYWRCPVCGRSLAGQSPAGPCTGAGGEAKPADLSCRFRGERGPSIECGECAKTGRARMVAVYACHFGGGRVCTLRPAKSEIIACANCGDRQPKE